MTTSENKVLSSNFLADRITFKLIQMHQYNDNRAEDGYVNIFRNVLYRKCASDKAGVQLNTAVIIPSTGV
jgi:hypothetical protein